MTTAQALIDALIAEYKVERDFIDALPAPSRTSHGTPEAWSALDLQGHITAWKHQTVLRLRNDPAAIIEGSEQETDQANADFFDSFAEPLLGCHSGRLRNHPSGACRRIGQVERGRPGTERSVRLAG